MQPDSIRERLIQKLGINPEGTTMNGKELGTSSSSCGNCADLPLFSIVDLDCMQHDPTIEEFLQRILPHDPLDRDPGDDELPISSMRMDDGDPWSSAELATTSVPPLDHLLPEYRGDFALPTAIRSLYAFEDMVRELRVSAIDLYRELRVNQVELHADMPPRVHVDGGAMASTTDRLDCLWHYREYTPEERTRVPRLRVADDHVHRPTGVGYLKIPCEGTRAFIMAETFYTPEIPASIASPDAIGNELGCKGYQTFSDFVDDRAMLTLLDCSAENGDLRLPLQRIRGLLYTDSVVAPTDEQRRIPRPGQTSCCAGGTCSSQCEPCAADEHPWRSTVVHPLEAVYCTEHINALSRDQQRTLWHMRLGHINHRRLSQAHEFADGIPNLPDKDPLHSCPLCLRAKLHKANRGPPEKIDLEQAECWDHIEIDVGFFVQKSSRKGDKDREKFDPDDITGSHLDVHALTRAQKQALAEQAAKLAMSSAESSDANDMSSAESSEASDDPEVSPAVQVYPTGTKVRKEFKGVWYDGKVISFDTNPESPYYLVEYEDGDKEEYTEDELRHLIPVLGTGEGTVPPTPGRPSRKPKDRPSRGNKPSRDFRKRPKRKRAKQVRETGRQRFERLKGFNGETCYVLITDRKSGAWAVSIRKDKSPALDFFRSWIARYGTGSRNRSVRFDGGGELGKSKDVHELFSKAGYAVEVTGPDSSSEIGAVERPHRIIADGVRTMLHSAGLPLSFWPYALRHFVLLANCIPRGDREIPPITICTGKRPDFRLLRIFGCRLFALPTHRGAKLDVDARHGVFLGFKDTFRHAYYYDFDTGGIKHARHVAFDESQGFHREPPPYMDALINARVKPADLPKGTTDQVDFSTIDDETLDVSLSPFTKLDYVEIPFDPSDKRPLGFKVAADSFMRRAFAEKFAHSGDAKKYEGAYILNIGGTDVFSQEDALAVIDRLRQAKVPPSVVKVTFATDWRDRAADRGPPPLHLRACDIRRIAALRSVAGEGTNSAHRRKYVRERAGQPSPGFTPAEPDDLVPLDAEELLEMRRLQNEHMTDEEKALPSFTRKNLMKLSNWSDWQKADDEQLEAHFKAGAIGKAVPRPRKDPDKPNQVFRGVWARLVKASGKRKSRLCLDGSKRSAPWLRDLVQTYASCIELPCLRMFMGMCAQRGYYIGFGDVDNAYQQSPPPSVDCFLEVDDTISDWYQRKYGILLDRLKEVIPLFKALQGHPEAGVLWERLITDILINKMGFKNTTHEKNIYFGHIDGHEILVCRQVDDFAAGSPTKEGSQLFIDTVRKYVEAEFHALGIETSQGTYERFNGIDVFQARDHIKIGCESYIDRMLETHGWSSPVHKDPANLVPIRPEITDKLMRLEGPAEKTPEAKEIERKVGFSYRNLLGELVYAYVICRVDIGFAVCFLARFSQAPHEEHFQALKQVCRYLRKTKDWGIIYRRPAPLMGLPHVEIEYEIQDPELPQFPAMDYDDLVGILDAAHATDTVKRRSVTGLMILFCRAAIAWKSRLQSLTATSSTEAEFYAAVECCKMMLYFRHVLEDLGFLKEGPSSVYIDNMACINIVNEDKPTPRCRHVETQNFAVQHWRKQGWLRMRHIPGTINVSDALTKALTWVLHARHVRRGMGHVEPTSISST